MKIKVLDRISFCIVLKEIFHNDMWSDNILYDSRSSKVQCSDAPSNTLIIMIIILPYLYNILFKESTYYRCIS